MHKLLTGAITAIAVAVMCLPALAQGNDPAERRFDLNLEQADLQAALQMLSAQTGTNLQFVFKPTSKPYAKITLSLKDKTVDEAVKFICEAAGAAFRKDPGGVYVIFRGEDEPEVIPPSGSTTAPDPVVKPAPKIVSKIPIKHGNPRTILEMLYGLLADQVGEWKALLEFRRMHAAELIGRGANTPVMMNTSASFSPINDLGNSNRGGTNTTGNTAGNNIDIPGGSGQLTPGRGSGGGGIGGGLGGGLGQGGGLGGGLGGGFGGQLGGGGQALQGGQGLIPEGIDRILYDPTDNSFIVQGTDDAIQQLEALIRRFDVAPAQVEIKVEFITTSRSKEQNFGIDWLYHKGSIFLGNIPGGQARSGDPFFVNWATGNLTTRLRTLLLEGDGYVVNAPMVRTLNNQPALILQQIDTWIILNQLISIGNGQVISAPTLQNISVSSGLSVQPRINADRYITMTISPQVAEFGQIRRGPNGEEVPDVLTQAIAVTCRVKDGETIVLGGLTRKQESFTVQRYPVLSDLPIIGNLFRSTSKKVNNQELLIFITPKIIPDDDGGIGRP